MFASENLYEQPKLITVFGGSGFVGRHVVETLTKRGYRVRIAVRHPEQAYYMLQMGQVGQIQMLKTNIGDRQSVERALTDAHCAIYLPGLLNNAGKNKFERVHVSGSQMVAELTNAAGIKLIHMSAIGADSDSAISYLKTKGDGEKAVRLAHPNAIILRPSIIFGPEDNFFNKFAHMAMLSYGLPLFGGGHTKLQPVYVGDVAQFIACGVEGGLRSGLIYELGGEQVLTFKETLEKMLAVIGRKRRLVSLPFSLGTALGSVLSLAGKVPLVPTLLTSGQVKMLQSDNVVSESAIKQERTLQAAGIEPTLIDAILPIYLWRFRPQGQFSRKTFGLSNH